jgi:hypothetical protein
MALKIQAAESSVRLFLVQNKSYLIRHVYLTYTPISWRINRACRILSDICYITIVICPYGRKSNIAYQSKCLSSPYHQELATAHSAMVGNEIEKRCLISVFKLCSINFCPQLPHPAICKGPKLQHEYPLGRYYWRVLTMLYFRKDGSIT